MEAVFQHSVNRPGLTAGSFSHSLGRPAGRCRQLNLDMEFGENLEDGVDNRGLSCARAAGNDHHLIGHCVPDGLGLIPRKRDRKLLLHPSDGLVGIDPPNRLRGIQEPCHQDGNSGFGGVKLREVDGFVVLPELRESAIEVLKRDFLFDGNRTTCPADHLPVHLKDLLGFLHEPVVRVKDVPIFGQLLKHIEDAGLSPDPAVFGKSKLLSDPVGGEKADAEDIRRQTVGILSDDLDGPIAIPLEDLGRKT